MSKRSIPLIAVIIAIALYPIGKFVWPTVEKARARWLATYVEKHVSDMAGEASYQICSGLAIHKTSATTYDLCDTNGMGVLDGQVIRIYLNTNDGLIVVGYVPFGYRFDEVNSVPLENLFFAYGRIDPAGNLTTSRLHDLAVTNRTECMIGDSTFKLRQLSNVDKWVKTHSK